MAKDNLQQLDEQIKFQHKYWESLSPEERRVSVLQIRDAQVKNVQKSTGFLVIIGFAFLAITIHFWLNVSHMSLMSSLGFVGGMFLAASGFYYIKLNRIRSYNKIQTNDFSDDDVIAYFREHERVNEKAIEQWHKYKYLLFVLGGLFVLSLNVRPTKDFSTMALFSGISIFLLGLVMYFVVQKMKSR